MRDVIIHQFVQRHNAANCPDGDVGLGQQTPDAKFPRIRMRLLEVIDLPHPGQPDFARGLLRATFFVHESGKVLSLKSRDPGIDGRPGDLQKAADTELIPALLGEFHDVEPRVITIGIGMIRP